MREGHCQLLNWRVEVLQTVLILYKLQCELGKVFVQDQQYGVAVLKNSEICDCVESRSNMEKKLLTCKCNSLVF